jgi:hypothetical protein
MRSWLEKYYSVWLFAAPAPGPWLLVLQHVRIEVNPMVTEKRLKEHTIAGIKEIRVL